MKPRRSLMWLAVAAVAFVAVAGAASAQSVTTLEKIQKAKTLRVGWLIWHPYIYRDAKTNTLRGIAVELIEDMGKALGANVEWVEDTTGTLPAGLQAGKFEIGIPIGVTLPRALVLGFSEPITKHGLSLLAPKDTVEKMSSWRDMDRAGAKIAVTLGSNTDLYLTSRISKAEIVRLKTVPEGVMTLVTGRVNAYASTLDSLRAIQKEHPGMSIAKGEFGSSEVAFPVRPDDQTWINWVNQFVREQKRTGRVTHLLEKYGLDSSFAAN